MRFGNAAAALFVAALTAYLVFVAVRDFQPATVATGAGTGNQIRIANISFVNGDRTVPAGTTVTWTNMDSVQHTVTADGGAFNASPLDPGRSFSFTFTHGGTYAYHCTIHPSMQGMITVVSGY